MLHSKLVWRSFCDKKKLKILFRGHMLFVILKVNESLQRFTKKNRKKQVKKSLGLKKQSRQKVINYMLNGKAMTILLIVGLIKKT